MAAKNPVDPIDDDPDRKGTRARLEGHYIVRLDQGGAPNFQRKYNVSRQGLGYLIYRNSDMTRDWVNIYGYG